MDLQLLAERYELRGLLGEGGMARVYEGFDRVLARRVAVKLLRDDIGGGKALRERMLREARAAASFHHPHAVAVFDTGQEGRTPYIVMELVEGGTLADEIAAHGRLEARRAIAIADEVLSALGAAHRRGLVHRDVKPANIMLPPGEGAKLADFGIAKGVEEAASLTMEGQVLGTPKYLAPEQVAGQPATVRSDVYAMGVVLYEMLAGEPPFTSDNPFAVALAHQEDRPPPLDRKVKGLDRGLVETVHRCLEKDPERRFASADSLRQALQDRSPTAVPAAASATTKVTPRGGDVPPRTAAQRPAAGPVAPQRPEGGRSWVFAFAAALVALILLGGFLAFRALDDAPVEEIEETTPTETPDPTPDDDSAPEAEDPVPEPGPDDEDPVPPVLPDPTESPPEGFTPPPAEETPPPAES